MKSIIAAFNMTGAPHVGNACVWRVSCRIAEREGLKLMLRYADRYEVPARRDEFNELLAFDGIQAMVRLTGYEAGDIPQFRWSERVPRYLEVAQQLIEMGLLERDGEEPDTWSMPSDDTVQDAVHGGIRPFCYLVLVAGQPYSTLTLVDAWDYDTPYHVRGFDLLCDANAEVRLHQLIGRSGFYCDPRPPRRYVHIPTICDGAGQPIHKSSLGPDSPYGFRNWATRFSGPDAVNRALDLMIAAHPSEPPNPYGISRAAQVWIESDGTRRKLVYPFERGHFCQRFYRDAPDVIECD